MYREKSQQMPLKGFGYFMLGICPVLNFAGCPMTVRMDAGTENGEVASMQTFLRRDGPQNKSPVLFGKSTGNQVLWSNNY